MYVVCPSCYLGILHCSKGGGSTFWKVVEFEGNDVAVVRAEWLTDNGKSCYWPAKENRKAVKNGDPNYIAWTKHPVLRVLYVTGKNLKFGLASSFFYVF